MNILTKTIIPFITVLMIASAILLNSCALHPKAWSPPPSPAHIGALAFNEELSKSTKISLDGWCGPEDIIFDNSGNLYCGVHTKEKDFSDGRILKIDSSGKVEVFYDSESWVAGLHFDNNGNMIALSHKMGLISIDKNKTATQLASNDEKGRAFLIPNGLTIASDGKIYFSNSSSRSPYTVKNGRKMLLEMKPDGGLFRYDPHTKKVATLIDSSYFGNGVVLNKDESFVLMVDLAKYRILRYWLKGENAGTTDIFINNLPGFPNGISRREDGSFWLGFTTRRNNALDAIHPKKGMKKIVYALPEGLQPQQEKFGMIMLLSEKGDLLQTLFDTSGNIISEAGAVKEHNGYLYIGGDIVPYISKYKLGEQFFRNY